MTPLALAGRAKVIGFTDARRRTLLRLADPSRVPEAEADAALIQFPHDIPRAIASGFRTAVAIDWNVENLGGFDRVVRLGSGLGWLAAGDVMAAEPRSGRYRVLWRKASAHNAFLVTDRCDHLCLMCSQPPKHVEDGWIIDEIRDCLPLLPLDTAMVGFTGGEPFLDWERFVPLATEVQERLPQTSIHVLTNGRAFARAQVVDAWSRLDRGRACVGIPIYSAVDAVHDYIVQSRHALDETVLGILRLKNKGNRVEVRVVLHRLTVERLVETCEWLARNLPFLDHVALMGMEETGFALANQAMLWVDPVDYGNVLTRAVRALATASLKVSVYNLPLCVLPEAVRSYAVRSISDWKNTHPEICATCQARERCAGFFSTGRPRLSRGIAPIKLAADHAFP